MMKKNPMDMAEAMFNLSLQFDKSAVPYAKREKVTSLKAFRALIMDKRPQMVTAMSGRTAEVHRQAHQAGYPIVTRLGGGQYVCLMKTVTNWRLIGRLENSKVLQVYTLTISQFWYSFSVLHLNYITVFKPQP